MINLPVRLCMAEGVGAAKKTKKNQLKSEESSNQ